MNDSLERPGLTKDVKVVVVGPAKSGKTALVQRFVDDTFSSVSVLTRNIYIYQSIISRAINQHFHLSIH